MAMYVNGYKLRLRLLHNLLLLCVSLLMVVAALSGATAVQAASASGGPFSVTVSSTLGWQKTSLSVTKGQSYTVSYVSGSWTVDYKNFPRVGPAGYSNSVDQTIYQGCKYDPHSNYAVLLGSISGSSSPDFPIGRGGRFTAASSGVLQLRINDDDA